MAPAVQHVEWVQQREDRALHWPRHTGSHAQLHTGVAPVLSMLTRVAIEESPHDAWLLLASW